MKAVIMAGGAGKRLRPLTCDCPKPMTPMMNRPVMAYGVELLKRHGVEDIAVTLQYLPQLVMDHFGDGEAMGVNMRYFVENEPLGTAGSVRQAREMLDETFCVVSGDALTDIDLTAALNFHKAKKAQCTLVLKRVDAPIDYGIVLLDAEGRVSRFYEKPGWEEIYSDLANTGIYIMEPEALERVPQGEFADFAQDLFPELLKSGAPIFGYVTGGYWCDIGDLAQYLQAHRDILDGRCKVSLRAERVGEAYIENGAFVDASAVIEGPCYIGSGAYIGEKAEVGPYSVIGSGARLERGAGVKRGVLWENASLGPGAGVRGAVICDGAVLKAGSCAYEEAVVGKNTAIGEGAVVKPNVAVWPYKCVEAHGVVAADCVWGGEKERLFEAGAFRGSIGLELSPAMAAKLGSAFALALSKQGRAVGVGSDGGSAAVAVKQALIAGLLAYGADVYDFERTTLPMLRFGMEALSLSGGAMVSESGGLAVSFLEEGGAPLPAKGRRSVEALFRRLDERPRMPPFLGVICMRRDITPFYRARLMRVCNRAAMASAPKRVLLRAEAPTEALLAGIFGEYGWSAYQTLPGSDFSLEFEKGYDAGFVIEDGELTVYDEEGSAISGQVKDALLALAFSLKGNGDALALPLDTPEATLDFFAARGAKVKRVKSDEAVLFKEISAISPDLALAWFDPIAGALLVAGCMAGGYSVNTMLELMPKAHLSSGFAPCSRRDVGRILRKMAENRDPACDEGVRVRHENGWALIRPDRKRPGFNVLAEGFSEEYAAELADFYIERVKALIKETDR